ncbi:MAG: transcription antitermination factor NusB [Verrucomicrobiales bacterium]|nr:transcription antitermination factor NusB [Verrucomicrobiales bacterium]|tara:strand:+ start:1653 stop:2063 length:411 start_codon:yes stop_codon:yes gene_type:complete
MGLRRDGRETAVQFLYSKDINNGFGSEDLETFFSLSTAKKGAKIFAIELVNGIIEKIDGIDEIIQSNVDNFEINRLSTIDRNVLRLAIYEMYYRDDIPAAVCINEAIEISKRLGTEESGSFVNGVLDKVKENIQLN